MSHVANEASRLADDWKANPRWEGVTRDYSAEDVVRLRGSVGSSPHWRIGWRSHSGSV